MSDIKENVAFVGEKVSFFALVGSLSKAVTDDEDPTPPYLLNRISGITYESSTHCQDLLSFLLENLDSPSPFVKIKVLKILLHTVKNGHKSFTDSLRKQQHKLEDVAKCGKPVDSPHEVYIYQKIRQLAKDLQEAMYSEVDQRSSLPQWVSSGMGSQGGSSQGFGNSPAPPKSLITSMRDAAQKVFSPSSEKSKLSMEQSLKYDVGQYSAVNTDLILTSSTHSQLAQSKTKLAAKETSQTKTYRPGVAGGGWADSEEEEEEGTVLASDVSVQSVDGSNMSGNQCGDASRLDAGEDDSQPEMSLLNEFVFTDKLLQPIRIQEFVKRCAVLNCETVLSQLSCGLDSSNSTHVTNCLLCLEALLCTDLITPDKYMDLCKDKLEQFDAKNTKARKVLLILKALASECNYES